MNARMTHPIIRILSVSLRNLASLMRSFINREGGFSPCRPQIQFSSTSASKIIYIYQSLSLSLSLCLCVSVSVSVSVPISLSLCWIQISVLFTLDRKSFFKNQSFAVNYCPTACQWVKNKLSYLPAICLDLLFIGHEGPFHIVKVNDLSKRQAPNF